MEFTPELSVLISSLKYAERKLGKTLLLVERDDCKKIVDQLDKEVEDIIAGLHSDHCDVERNWWNCQLHSIFLLKALEGYRHVQSCRVKIRDDGSEPNSLEDTPSSWPNQDVESIMNESKRDTFLLIKSHDNCTYVHNREVPLISVDIYLTAMVKFNWFCFFEESGCYLCVEDIMILSCNILDHIKNCSSDSNCIPLVSSFLGFLLTYKLTNASTNNARQNPLNCMEDLSDLINEYLYYVSARKDALKCLDSTYCMDLVFRILMVPFMFVEAPHIFKHKNVNDSSRKIFHMLNVVRAMGESQMIQASDEMNLPVSKKFQFLPWLSCCITLFNIFDTLQFDLFVSPTFCLLDFQICTENVLNKLLSLKTLALSGIPSSKCKDVVMVFDVIEGNHKKYKIINDNLRSQLEIEKSFKNYLRRIEERSKGFEDDVEYILDNSDPDIWLNGRTLDVLSKQPAILSKENHIYKLSEIYYGLQSQVKTSEANSLKFIMLIFEVFKSTPVLLQEKFILQTYKKFGSSHHLKRDDLDLTSTMNRFTSQSTTQILVEVACFLLSDTRSTIKALLDTVLSNEAQIDTVVKIFHSFPNLCRYHHPVEHPNLSLLVFLLQQIIISSELTVVQEQNLLKFISMAVQDYEFQILNDNSFRENALINVKELLQTFIQYLSVDNLYLYISPMNLELTIKLITTVINKSVKKGKSCNWFFDFNHVVILSVIGHIYNECVNASDLEYGRRFHVRQLISKLLAAWKTALKVIDFSVKVFEISWLMMELDECSWPAKFLLHKHIADFIPDGRLMHGNVMEEALQVTFLYLEQDYKPLIQFSIVNDECLSLISDKLHQGVHYSPLQVPKLKATLIQVLPNLISSEWSRLNQLISTLIQQNLLIEPIRLPFLDKIQHSLLSEVWHIVGGVQILTDVILNIFLSSSLCEDVVIHISKCYSTLLSTLVKQMNIQGKPRSELIFLTIIQFTSYLCVIMAMSFEVQDILFICLLDLLENLKDCYRSGEKVEFYQINSIITAASVIPVHSMRNTIEQKINNIMKIN